ncbi:MAG: hypothetical protein AAF984_00645 [Verrucomicrobiota bacterium]
MLAFTADKFFIEKVISLVDKYCPCDVFKMRLAKLFVMWDKPNARRSLDHYILGRGTDLYFSTGELLAQDDGVCSTFYDGVRQQLDSGADKGLVSVPQWMFRSKDWKYALGGVDLNWMRTGDCIEIQFKKKYSWSPVERRVTQKLHEIAARLIKKGAKNFHMQGRPVKVNRNSIYKSSLCKKEYAAHRQYLL